MGDPITAEREHGGGCQCTIFIARETEGGLLVTRCIPARPMCPCCLFSPEAINCLLRAIEIYTDMVRLTGGGGQP